MNSLADERIMRRAIELAKNNPRFPFGAVITVEETNEIIAEGWNRSSQNPTWHGEIVAINELCKANSRPPASNLTLYTTAEPCPMCQSAILWAEIPRVRFGTSIRTLQRLGWPQIDIESSEIIQRSPGFVCQSRGGIAESECDDLFENAIRLDADSLKS